ncbi:aspartyl-tRNA(Asn)/glutamyl-tRNA(Gln) amidotransferase subunit A [Loktanella salsilacus]|uniref:Aspartyl-tRNA(Asn)/glutamyl-tRNA(Gln) amidotransferase subunit A n=1 Tax=Loktanella salsilacus TaxID=195913 RepID=A0A1I4FSH5_9RHOB|nr:amidase [Loktanella salsilacus]SFL20543.1 aspartyl-tRNA(Asn)/glutamyl-tRNA(Gln) amidotransferase subunit A [Loktanella salsilacus]
MDDLEHADVTALLAQFAAGMATPNDAAALVLDRIARIDPKLNAYSTLSQTLLAEAQAATDRWARGVPQGLLDGVPIVVKDNLVSRGLPASWGNAALSTRMAAHDEVPVARLRAAGALVIGKGNTPEFAVDGYTENLTFGVTRNPFDTALTPGGSSGGVVAAVASGMAFAGLATDGGGSIRRPAGYTGLVGLKPGIGRVARGGGLPQLLLDFEVAGPIARSLRDLRLLNAVLSGQAGRAQGRAQGRILAIPVMGDAPCDPVILQAFADMCEALRGRGHRVITGDLPYDLSDLNAGWGHIAEVGLAAYFQQDPAVAAAAAQKYQAMAARGRAFPASEFQAIQHAVTDLRRAAQGLWGYDAILTPTSAAQPWPAHESHPAMIAGKPAGPRGHAVYTGWVNAAGLPAIAFPATIAAGLPIGLQLIGPAQSEGWLMDAVEQIISPFRWPNLPPAG